MALDGLYKIIIKNKHAIRQKAEDRINSLVEEYIPDDIENAPCPAPADLQRIIFIREQIRGPLLNLNKRVQPLDNFLQKVPPILETVQGIIIALKLLPIPNTFTTAGLVVTFGDTLAFLKDKVKDFKQEVRNGNQVIGGVQEDIANILEKLSKIDTLIEKCTEGVLESNPEFASLISTQLNQTSTNPLEAEYRDYQIKIEEEQVGKLTRRFAVAINEKGERIITTEKSFSASTQILIDEAKFEVDKLLQ